MNMLLECAKLRQNMRKQLMKRQSGANWHDQPKLYKSLSWESNCNVALVSMLPTLLELPPLRDGFPVLRFAFLAKCLEQVSLILEPSTITETWKPREFQLVIFHQFIQRIFEKPLGPNSSCPAIIKWLYREGAQDLRKNAFVFFGPQTPSSN